MGDADHADGGALDMPVERERRFLDPGDIKGDRPDRDRTTRQHGNGLELGPRPLRPRQLPRLLPAPRVSGAAQMDADITVKDVQVQVPNAGDNAIDNKVDDSGHFSNNPYHGYEMFRAPNTSRPRPRRPSRASAGCRSTTRRSPTYDANINCQHGLTGTCTGSAG